MISNLLQNRRTYIKNMLLNGIPVENIARFYETTPLAIEKSMKNLENFQMPSSPNVFTPQQGKMLIESRDNLIAKQMSFGMSEEEALTSLGFHKRPSFSNLTKNLADRAFQTATPEAKDLLSGKTVSEMAKERGISTNAMGRIIAEQNIDPSDIKKQSKQYRKLMETAEICELWQCGFSVPEIQRYTGQSEFSIRKNIHLAESYGLTRQEDQKEIVKSLIKDLVPLSDIAEIMGMGYSSVSKIKKEMIRSHECSSEELNRKEAIREKIYQIYTVENKTMQEIADEWGLTRETVSAYITQYENDHPDRIDDTVLWQRRNLSAPAREKMAEKRAKFDHVFEQSKSIAKATSASGLCSLTVKRHMKYKGYESDAQKRRRKMEETILKDVRNGIPIPIIAHTHRWKETTVTNVIQNFQKTCEHQLTQAKELKMAYQYPAYKGHGPTTTIMAELGRSRNSVLEDQHATCAYLRNNAQAHRIVQERKGDVEELVAEK